MLSHGEAVDKLSAWEALRVGGLSLEHPPEEVDSGPLLEVFDRCGSGGGGSFLCVGKSFLCTGRG